MEVDSRMRELATAGIHRGHLRKLRQAATALGRARAREAQRLRERDAAIFEAFDAGMTIYQIADAVGITPGRVGHITNGTVTTPKRYRQGHRPTLGALILDAVGQRPGEYDEVALARLAGAPRDDVADACGRLLLEDRVVFNADGTYSEPPSLGRAP